MAEINVSVSNFEPIGKEKATIKPLTILLGGNNTGKSYCARGFFTFATCLTSNPLSITLYREAIT